jgi:hypothetical protein
MVAHINLLALLFVVALLVAAARGRHGPVAERFLSWILLLPIGITGLWAEAFHVFFPATAAKLIEWEVSPFQFEVGMQRRCSVLHGHHLPDAGHRFFINRETTKVLGVTLTAEQSAKIFKSVGAGFERLGTGAITEVVLLNQILVDTSGTQANLELSANHLSQAFAPTPASSPNAGNRNGWF